jgi:hypothetical protein
MVKAADKAEKNGALTDDQLERLISEPDIIMIGEQEIKLKRYKIRQFREILNSIKWFRAKAKGEKSIESAVKILLLNEGTEALDRIMAFAKQGIENADEVDLEELEIADIFNLITAIFSYNADFFPQPMQPEPEPSSDASS